MNNASMHHDIIPRFKNALDTGDNSFATLMKALDSVADDLSIGRIFASMEESRAKKENDNLNDHQVLFEREDDYDEAGIFSIPFKSITGARGDYHILPRKDHCFTDEEKIIIVQIFQLADAFIAKIVAGQQIEETATHQKLTGLLNVDGYMKEVRKKYARGIIDQYDAYNFNLASFGLINRKYDRHIGDTALLAYADLLSDFISEDEILCQLGGDGFTALIRKDRSEAFREFIKAQDIAIRSDRYEDINITIRTRAGYMHMEKDTPYDEVVGGPSIALADARLRKVACVELTDDLRDRALYEKNIEHDFETALAGGEFVVHYQPKVETDSNRIIGAEALARWNQNGRIVMPVAFIQTLEKVGKIVKLDLYMLEKVCMDISDWKKRGIRTVPVSVNFSRRDLMDPTIAATIAETIGKYGIEKEEIIVEITETTSVDELDQLSGFINGLHSRGIRISIDDFGTGFSSLSLIRDYPVNEIKIDKSFINRTLTRNDEVLISGIIEIANRLNLEVIAEGVEQKEQRDFLLKVGCHRVQGFLYDEPMSKEEFEMKLLEGSYEI